MPWDPQHYLTFADHRGRPFVDLLARIDAAHPDEVLDIGCGPGNLTHRLAQRWPGAHVAGIDSSAEMIARARADWPEVDFAVEDLRDRLGNDDFGPDRSRATTAPVDVLIANAVLQWVPGHLGLLPALVRSVRRGGWLAFQVPGNFDQPSHTLCAELAAEPPYAGHADVALPASHDAATYLHVLADLGCHVDAWETTYLHVLTGTDPVFTWISATGARLTLEALGETLRPRFEEEFRRRLRGAYPDTGHGVVMPFRRIFVVAKVAS